jgi:hypothetical protein
LGDGSDGASSVQLAEESEAVEVEHGGTFQTFFKMVSILSRWT